MSNKIRYTKKSLYKPKLIDTNKEIEPEIERVSKSKFIYDCVHKIIDGNYEYCVLKYKWCPFKKCGDYKKRS